MKKSTSSQTNFYYKDGPLVSDTIIGTSTKLEKQYLRLTSVSITLSTFLLTLTLIKGT